MISVWRRSKRVCPACGQEMKALRRKAKLYWRFLPKLYIYYPKRIKCGDYFYYKCGSCSHTILDIPEKINLQYQSDYRKNKAMNGDIVNDELGNGYYANREWILNERVAKIGNFIQDKESIFDIGCGGGYVLDYYQKKGYQVTGVEIDDLSVDACRRLGIKCIKGDFLNTELEGKYDVVMAWHILEHVLDINTFIKKMVDTKNENGLLVLEVPIDRQLIANWKNYDGHVHYFTRESLERLAYKFNVKPVYSGEGVQKPAWLLIGEIE